MNVECITEKEKNPAMIKFNEMYSSKVDCVV